MRTNNLADPRAWRAWDGQGFNIQFIDPYTDPYADPAAHVCEPVSPSQLGVTAQGLVWSAAFTSRWALNADQRNEAILKYRVADLVLGPGQDGRTIQPEGIRAAKLSAGRFFALA